MTFFMPLFLSAETQIRRLRRFYAGEATDGNLFARYREGQPFGFTPPLAVGVRVTRAITNFPCSRAW